MPPSVSATLVILQVALFGLFVITYFADSGPRLLPEGYAADVLALAGAVLCALAAALSFDAFLRLRRSFRVSPEPHRSGRLVREGVYRYLRHPMYNAVTLLCSGLVLRSPRWTTLAAAVAVVVLLALKARHEERLLAARYPEYAAYARGTVGVVPGMRANVGRPE